MDLPGELKIECRTNGAGLVERALLALCSTALCYDLFFLLAPWIWKQNIPFHPHDITPWILEVIGQDGLEIYALYLLCFVGLGTALALSWLAGHLRQPQLRIVLFALCLVKGAAFLIKTGFNPPVNTLDEYLFFSVLPEILLVTLVAGVVYGCVFSIYCRFPSFGIALAAIVVAPSCFIATSAVSQFDYSYIFAPALRMLDGVKWSDIYFQYDVLPSLLATIWLQFGLDLNSFQLLGRAAYYLALLALFIFSGKLFRKKELAFFLLVTLVLARIYASPWDATLVFQVTPLRLDLWIPLVFIVYRFGPYHWGVGLFCGVLLVLLKTFGIIYSLAYIQLVLTLWAINYFGDVHRPGLWGSIVGYLRKCYLPLAIIAIFGVVSYGLFRNVEYRDYVGYYQKIGIGFLKIEPTSFYWYVPTVLSTAFLLLLKLRQRLPPAYLDSCLLVLFCAVGNSIYFFGRSHEHNLINLSLVLVFLLFILLDLIVRWIEVAEATTAAVPPFISRGVRWLGIVPIMLILLYYSVNIEKKLVLQAQNASDGSIIYPGFTVDNQFVDFLDKLKQVTGSSKKLYFIDEADFAFYYYGGYAQTGYCNPFYTWIFTKDLHRFLQNLLDNGYYLVCSPTFKYVLIGLHFDSVTDLGTTSVVALTTRRGGK